MVLKQASVEIKTLIRQQYFNMFAYIRKTFEKITNFFYRDPFQRYNEQMSNVDDLIIKFEQLNTQLDHFDTNTPPLQAEPQANQQDDMRPLNQYQEIVIDTYKTLPLKQREFYPLLTFSQFQGVLEALKKPAYSRLQPRKWLNDENINNFLKAIDRQPDTIILSSLNFPLLFNADDNKFRRTTSKAKFTQDTKFVLIPYNSNNTHWFTIQIDLDQAQINLFDSMQGKSYNDIIRKFENFASRLRQQEYQVTLGECPQQDNCSDCGVFTIKNIQILAKYPYANLNLYYSQDTIFYDRLCICAQLLA